MMSMLCLMHSATSTHREVDVWVGALVGEVLPGQGHPAAAVGAGVGVPDDIRAVRAPVALLADGDQVVGVDGPQVCAHVAEPGADHVGARVLRTPCSPRKAPQLTL